ncbi:MAG TPA: acetate--CoA ligase family protein [Candidatus Methylomirabilis sp.]|nr:acetate--CoA ligase family protein [Candidatus Methylomirabilis sp.]
MAIAIGKAMQEGRNLLEPEAYELLAAYGVSVPQHRVVTSAEEAEAAAGEVGYPVVAKIVSPDILHKTEVGGVLLNLNDAAAVRAAYRHIVERSRQAKATLKGILISRMAPPGTEVIAGLTQDAQFGPVVMFGLGGVFVEVYRDVSFRLVPLTEPDAVAMIREIKAFPILQGIRGGRSADLTALADLLLTVSRMGQENPEIAEMDLNPIIVYEKGLSVVDARVLLHHKAAAA